MDKKRLLFKSAVEMTVDDAAMYLENVSGQEEIPADDVQLSVNKRTAIVTFKTGVEIELIKKSLSSTPGMQLTVEPVTNQIVVSKLSQDLEAEFLTLYFEDKKSCPSGGDVESVFLHHSRRAAVVTFTDPKVAERLCLHGQCKIQDQVVDIELWNSTKNLDDFVSHDNTLRFTDKLPLDDTTHDSTLHFSDGDELPLDTDKHLADSQQTDSIDSPNLLNPTQSFAKDSTGVRSKQSQTMTDNRSIEKLSDRHKEQIPRAPSRSVSRQKSNTAVDEQTSHQRQHHLEIQLKPFEKYLLIKLMLDKGYYNIECAPVYDEARQTVTVFCSDSLRLQQVKDTIESQMTKDIHSCPVRIPVTSSSRTWVALMFSRARLPAVLISEQVNARIITFEPKITKKAKETLDRRLLTGKVPYGDRNVDAIKKYITSVKGKKFFYSIQANKAVILSYEHECINVFGVPKDVVTVVGEIEDKFTKKR